MRKTWPFLPLVVAFTLTSLNALGQDTSFEQRVRAYLLDHPEVIAEALGVLEKRRTAALIASVGPKLTNDETDLVLGNPDGDVTVVKFFDYRCQWCRKAHTVTQRVLADNPDVKLVIKQFPVLGNASVTASRLALATLQQSPSTYPKLHMALLEAGGSMSSEQILDIAADVGLNPDALEAAANSDQVTRAISRSYEMAQIFKFGGTPAFVIGTQLAPGFLDYDAMTAMIEAARAEASQK